MPNINSGFQRIIPTPQSAILVDLPARIFTRDTKYTLCLKGTVGEKLKFAAEFLCNEALRDFSLHLVIGESSDEAAIIICSDYTLLNEHLDADCLKVFDNDIGRDQGYIITGGIQTDNKTCISVSRHN